MLVSTIDCPILDKKLVSTIDCPIRGKRIVPAVNCPFVTNGLFLQLIVPLLAKSSVSAVDGPIICGSGLFPQLIDTFVARSSVSLVSPLHET